jgi:hypothetical protein
MRIVGTKRYSVFIIARIINFQLAVIFFIHHPSELIFVASPYTYDSTALG